MNSIAFNNWINRYQIYCRKEGDGYTLSFRLLDDSISEVSGESVIQCVRLAITKQIDMVHDSQDVKISGFRTYDDNLQGWMFYLSPEYIIPSSDIEECAAILYKDKLEILLYSGHCRLYGVNLEVLD